MISWLRRLCDWAEGHRDEKNRDDNQHEFLHSNNPPGITMLKTNTDGKPLDPHGYLHFVALKEEHLPVPSTAWTAANCRCDQSISQFRDQSPVEPCSGCGSRRTEQRVCFSLAECGRRVTELLPP